MGEEMREEYYAGLEERRLLSYEKAMPKRMKIDWAVTPPVCAPKQLGVQHITGFPLTDVMEYIDWSPFFQTWELRGRYPNRGYPKIFNDERVGEEAKKLFDDAVAMIKLIVDGKLLNVKGVVGLYAANSVGDDVEVYEGEDRTKAVAT